MHASVTQYLLYLRQGNGVGGSCQLQLISNPDNTSPTPFSRTRSSTLHKNTSVSCRPGYSCVRTYVWPAHRVAPCVDFGQIVFLRGLRWEKSLPRYSWYWRLHGHTVFDLEAVCLIPNWVGQWDNHQELLSHSGMSRPREREKMTHTEREREREVRKGPWSPQAAVPHLSPTEAAGRFSLPYLTLSAGAGQRPTSPCDNETREHGAG